MVRSPANTRTRPTARTLIATIVVALLAPAPVMPAPASLSSARICWEHKPTELLLARLVNRKRTARDISKLKLDKHLARVSRKHTSEMIRSKVFEHTPIATLAERVTNWIELGENIGRSTERARAIIRNMMDSPLHRANILNPTFTYFGIGTKRSGGRIWATVTFEARDDPGTTLKMPRC